MQTLGAKRRREAGHARGFTLIEVLAALVIVALGMLGVIQVVSQTARNGTYLRDKTLAHWIAMNVITERRLMPNAPDVAESSDEVEFAGQRWHWTLKVTQTDVESLRRMDVSVRPLDAPENSSLASVSGFYGTAIGPSGGGAVVWAGGQGTGGPNDGTDGDGNDNGDGNASEDGGGNGGSGDESPTGAPVDPEPDESEGEQ
jgi:general secretion pathway protein I